MEAWISSKVRPFVSGTNLKMNTIATAQNVANTENAPEKKNKIN